MAFKKICIFVPQNRNYVWIWPILRFSCFSFHLNHWILVDDFLVNFSHSLLVGRSDYGTFKIWKEQTEDWEKKIKKGAKSLFFWLETKFISTAVSTIVLVSSTTIVFTFINFVGERHNVWGTSPLKLTVINKAFCCCCIFISPWI